MVKFYNLKEKWSNLGNKSQQEKEKYRDNVNIVNLIYL